MPNIGVFWIYQKCIYFKSIEVSKIKAMNDLIDSDFSYYKVWDKISSKNNDFYLYKYEDIPRGRVVYDVENTQYIIYSNHDIVNLDEAQGLIIEAFNLDTTTVLFQYDAHYKIF